MSKHNILERASDSRYIPGIYNYCDRWCEKCQFTSRCLVYAMEKEDVDSEEMDLANAAFWQKLGESFQATLELLKEKAQEMGIDLDSPETELIAENRENVIHIISHLSKRYSSMVDEFFNIYSPFLEDLILSQENNLKLRLVQLQKKEATIFFKDIVEVIRWYQDFIHVKLRRALYGKSMDDALLADDDASDANGSAKIALIAIDRSISAWGELLKDCSAKKPILDIINHLKLLREMTEKEFPEVRAFVRPGFDEVAL